MPEKPVPVAVVGTGNMGSNHVRVFDELPSADLVEIVEPDPERASEIGEQYEVAVHERVEELQTARAATVAAPNEYHRSTAEALLDRGLDVMMEKPLASTVEDARAIVDAVEAADAVLQVGHIERFNPAVETLAEILEDEELIAIEAHRLGPFNEQLSEESVVFDLMIHDIDVIDSLVESDIEHLDAVGVASQSDALDQAVSHLKFEGDVLGTATASHVTHGKIRSLAVTTEDAYIELDYQQQSIQIQRRGIESMTHLHDRSGYRTETITERPLIQREEPLKLELEAFLSNVANRTTPLVDGIQGVRAVRLASEIVDQISCN